MTATRPYCLNEDRRSNLHKILKALTFNEGAINRIGLPPITEDEFLEVVELESIFSTPISVNEQPLWRTLSDEDQNTLAEIMIEDIRGGIRIYAEGELDNITDMTELREMLDDEEGSDHEVAR